MITALLICVPLRQKLERNTKKKEGKKEVISGFHEFRLPTDQQAQGRISGNHTSTNDHASA